MLTQLKTVQKKLGDCSEEMSTEMRSCQEKMSTKFRDESMEHQKVLDENMEVYEQDLDVSNREMETLKNTDQPIAPRQEKSLYPDRMRTREEIKTMAEPTRKESKLSFIILLEE